MGTSLTGTKPKDTYDSLIKVGDNGPISGTAKYLSDGLGNDLPIAVSTSNVGIGTSAPAGNLHIASASDTGIRIQAGASNLSYIDLADTASGTPAGSIAYNHIVNAITFATGTNVERARIDSDGLKFNGDTLAANALDDYEEGTWTMGISFGNASTGIAYTRNEGTYTKIGRQVTVQGYLTLSSKGSATGGARITGLPFTISNNAAAYSAATMWLNNISFANQYNAISQIGSTNIEFYEVTEAGAFSALTDADFANSSEVIFSMSYIA